MTSLVITFIGYLLAVFALAIWARKQGAQTPIEFSLAGRKLGWLTSGLSAISTQYSAWLFMGWVGMAYLMGLSVLWLTLGVIPCVAIGWFWMAPRFRQASERVNALTVTEYLAEITRSRLVLVVGSAIGILFMLAYVAAQFVGASKLLSASFGLDYTWSVALAACFVAAYLLIGGYRSDCYTDMLQGALMIVGMIALPTVAIAQVGVQGFVDVLRTQHASLLQPWMGWVMALVLPWGQLSLFGMPHVMKRMMSMKSSKQSRKVALTFGIPALLLPIGGVLVGLAGRVLLSPLADAESCFPLLAGVVFGPTITGVVIAASMAAIMSSMDSQLLYTATEVAQNLGRRLLFDTLSPRDVVRVMRWSIVSMTVIGVILALYYSGLVFTLVVFAVAGLTACFGPPVLMSVIFKRLNHASVIASMTLAPLAAVIWTLATKPGLLNSVAATPVGFVVGVVILCVGRLIDG